MHVRINFRYATQSQSHKIEERIENMVKIHHKLYRGHVESFFLLLSFKTVHFQSRETLYYR